MLQFYTYEENSVHFKILHCEINWGYELLFSKILISIIQGTLIFSAYSRTEYYYLMWLSTSISPFLIGSHINHHNYVVHMKKN